MSEHQQVVLIITDTQRRDMVGAFGHQNIRTPELDRLAREGVLFERAYCTQPVCGPSRSAMFTGVFPHLNGSWSNNMPLGDTVKTIGQRLTDRGIACGFVGKWHLDGSDYFGTGECPPGWNPAYWYDMRCYLEEMSPEDRVRSRQVGTIDDQDISEVFTYAHHCSDKAMKFLADHQATDFLLVVSYDEPHGPFLAPRRYADSYANFTVADAPNLHDSLEHKPEHIRVWANTEQSGSANWLPSYLGCNTFVDHEIGRVLRAIDQFAPEALIIYTSDHGDALGAHGIHGKGPAMYEEVAGIPLLVRWPGHSPVGVRCSEPISHIDLTPTILEAFGLEKPASCHGESLLELFRHPNIPTNRAVYIEFHRYEIDHDGFGGFQPIRSVCRGAMKLIINLLTTDELYNLDKDPYEMSNLIDDPAYTVCRNDLHDQLLEWMNHTRDPFRGYYWERRPWRTDARPATWDYTGMTRQRENEGDERRQLDYATGLEMKDAVRKK